MKKFLVILLAVCIAGGIGFDAQARKTAKKKKAATSATSTAKISQVKANLVGTYLLNLEACAGTKEMQHDAGKYEVTDTEFAFYSWEDGKGWVLDFKVPYTIKYNRPGSYMAGYCIAYDEPGEYGGPREFCTGDVDGNGRMDIWQSDCMFWTKQ